MTEVILSVMVGFIIYPIASCIVGIIVDWNHINKLINLNRYIKRGGTFDTIREHELCGFKFDIDMILRCKDEEVMFMVRGEGKRSHVVLYDGSPVLLTMGDRSHNIQHSSFSPVTLFVRYLEKKPIEVYRTYEDVMEL